MRTIAFYSAKGGVGKTTAAVNIAYLASAAGIPTLLWDLDPQGASSWYLAGAEDVKGKKLSKLIAGDSPIGEFVYETRYPQLDFIPAHKSYRNLDVRLDQSETDDLLRQWLAPLSEETGLVVLDCPPSLSRLTEQILTAADHVFVPVIPTWLSLNSWNQLQDFAKDKKVKSSRLHPFFSMADRRKNLHRDLTDNRTVHLPNSLKAVVPFASVVERMGENGTPLELSARTSDSARAFRELWKEIRNIVSI